MFYLNGRRKVSGNPNRIRNADEFGWYLEDHVLIEDKIYDNSPQRKKPPNEAINNGPTNSLIDDGTTSLNSVISIFACNNFSDESDNYLADCDAERSEEAVEYIRMNSLSDDANEEINIRMIEEDAGHCSISFSTTERSGNSLKGNETVRNAPRGISYTPERLVRSQEYRILTPSPRYLAIPCNNPNSRNNTPRRYRGHRKKIADLRDAKQFESSHLEAFLDAEASEVQVAIMDRRKSNFHHVSSKKGETETIDSTERQDASEIAIRDNRKASESPDIGASTGSSFERLNSSWEDRSKIIRESSQEDTSGIHSNDWSTDTPSDIQTPICLSDELASVSRTFGNIIESKNRTTAINEVVSILEGLEKDPDRVIELLEEDRFCETTSGHDNLTRLALTIEPDGSVPLVLGDPNNIVDELRGKVERLQEATRNIVKDVDVLREDFECNESKVDELLDATIALRRDASEMRYMDDLLSLLDGELERISKRNWPFVFGHSELRSDDMNLVV